MSLKRVVAVTVVILAAALLVVSCGMNSEEKRLAAAIDQALQTRKGPGRNIMAVPGATGRGV